MYYVTRAEAYHLTKFGNPINKEFEIKGKQVVNDYGMQARIYYNSHTIRTHKLAEIQIKEMLKKMVTIKFYKNFIIINGKTFNGWNKEMIDILITKIYQAKPKAETLQFEWEEA